MTGSNLFNPPSPAEPSWRDRIKVHPAVDAFPMMSDEELIALGKDIKKNGLQSPITFHTMREVAADTDTAFKARGGVA
jgi:hypothetical protein